MSREQKLRNAILDRYISLRQFAEKADIPYSTFKSCDGICLRFFITKNTDICLTCLKIRSHFYRNYRCPWCNTWILYVTDNV